jgi:hypothetical protein
MQILPVHREEDLQDKFVMYAYRRDGSAIRVNMATVKQVVENGKKRERRWTYPSIVLGLALLSSGKRFLPVFSL